MWMLPYLLGKMVCDHFDPTLQENTHMVTQSNNRSSHAQGKNRTAEPIHITPSTPHEYIDERFTSFGGLLAFVKMLAAFKVDELFGNTFIKPKRMPQRGHYFMFQGLMYLLIIGFQRLYHFSYIAHDPMLLGVLRIEKLPAVSTFWRWLKSCGINQANSLLKLMAALRARVWSQVGFDFTKIHIDVDTTVETVYGDIEGARVGHNRQHRGKKGLRPILAFIGETKEYVWGKLRRGTTVSGKDVVKTIKALRAQLPSCVKEIVLRADSEFFSEAAVKECEQENLRYLIAAKNVKPEFDSECWYHAPKGNAEIQYNSCDFKPGSWKTSRRFIVMRKPKKDASNAHGQQPDLFEDGDYTYRTFVTDRLGSAHKLIAEYDGRAACETLIGEAKREGLCAIPSKRFLSNMVFFQIVMFIYNLWRYMQAAVEAKEKSQFRRHTVHVARLKILFVAAKIVRHSAQVRIKFSQYLDVRPQLEKVFQFFENLIAQPEIWDRPRVWGVT